MKISIEIEESSLDFFEKNYCYLEAYTCPDSSEKEEVLELYIKDTSECNAAFISFSLEEARNLANGILLILDSRNK